jgi:aminodeoxyfutalosine deaminase
MIYRKFKADVLFTGYKFLTGGEVLVTDENGRVQEIVEARDAGDAEYLPGTICPGFVNAHCHLELSWMKGLLPKGTGMIDFLIGVMKTPPAKMNEVIAAIDTAEQSMLAAGIIAVGDICNTSFTLAAKERGNLYYHNFIEAMGFVEASAWLRFVQAVKLFNEFAAAYPIAVVSNSIVPHAPYSVSQALFQKITAFPGNRLLSIHNQEHAAENEFFLQGTGEFHRLFQAIGVDSSFHSATGTSSLAHYLPWFKPNQTVLLVHNVETSSHDLELISAA